jgi:hypothetical protein
MEEVQEHVEGRPWKTIGRFDDYPAANATRNQLLEDPDIQVKVHRCAIGGKLFAVKTRLIESKITLDKKKKK